eukprot:6192282-Pleurochrysis_carterae.AAC.1
MPVRTNEREFARCGNLSPGWTEAMFGPTKDREKVPFLVVTRPPNKGHTPKALVGFGADNDQIARKFSLESHPLLSLQCLPSSSLLFADQHRRFMLSYLFCIFLAHLELERIFDDPNVACARDYTIIIVGIVASITFHPSNSHLLLLALICFTVSTFEGHISKTLHVVAAFFQNLVVFVLEASQGCNQLSKVGKADMRSTDG